MMKKLTALVLALVMVLVLGVTAFAAEGDPNIDPELGSFEGSNNRGYGVSEGEVPLTKSLIIFNPDSATVREPNLDFVYTVSPVTAEAELGTVTDDGRYNDDTPVTLQVNAGEAGAVTGVTLQFRETNTVSAKPTGTEVEKSGNLTVNVSKFSHAGIYRYKITETVKNAGSTSTISDLSTYGLEARTRNYDTERYLDLYIVNGTDGLELSSAVIFKTNSVDDDDTEVTEAITTTTDKTTGYEPGTETPASGAPDYTDDDEVDRYFTYNLKVNKTTVGALADKSHDFPFVITLTAASTLVPTVKTDLTVQDATGEEAGTRNIVKGTPLVLQPKMSDSDYIELKGIPKGTTVTVKETNNTPDVYTASWDETEGTTSTATVTSDNDDNTNLSLANGKSASASAVNIDGNQTTEYKETVLGFTNTMAEISPTGVVLRVAPYALMLGAGIFLLLISRKRKDNAEDA